jgi:hypothetical protein
MFTRHTGWLESALAVAQWKSKSFHLSARVRLPPVRQGAHQVGSHIRAAAGERRVRHLSRPVHDHCVKALPDSLNREAAMGRLTSGLSQRMRHRL